MSAWQQSQLGRRRGPQSKPASVNLSLGALDSFYGSDGLDPPGFGATTCPRPQPEPQA
jgi:hypothetical protein